MKTETAEYQQKITLLDYYEKLPKSEFILFRNRVCTECAVSPSTFYRWLRNPAEVAPGNRLIIENIVGPDKLTW
jgi:hypothetical protein